jgi:hypothetical protein
MLRKRVLRVKDQGGARPRSAKGMRMFKVSGRVAVAIVVGVAAFSGASGASAAEFSTVVRQILDNQTDGPLTEMDSDKRAEMTSCVIDTLQGLPSGLQRRIVEAGDLEAQEDEFGKVVDAEMSPASFNAPARVST